MKSKLNDKLIIGLGEFLIRFTAERGTLIREARNYVANYGGSEANVIISLCHLGHKGRYITRVSDDELGLGAIDYLKTQNVDTSFIQKRGQHPLGTSIVEEGEGVRPSVVIYNRKWSSAAQMRPENFDFESILKDGCIFHVSGISLSISEKARCTTIEAMKIAKKLGLKVSFDFNYRSKLLSIDDAKKIYPIVTNYADIVSASKWDIKTLLGFSHDDKNSFNDACKEYGFDYIFSREREIISSREQIMQGFAYSKDETYISDKYKFEIFDRIGAGDAFVAGYLHGLLKNKNDINQALRYGMANCILEQTILGDCARFSEDDLNSFLNSSLQEVKR